MQDKIETSAEMLQTVARIFQRPAVLCSFGKDSMAMLHLIRNAGYSWPVVFFREPFMAEKYDFANGVIRDWDLTVYDYPARFRTVLSRMQGLEVMGHYPFGRAEIMLPTGLYEPEDFSGKWLCAKDDVFARPCGDFRVPWDVMLVGHKDTDRDPLQGGIPLHVDYKQTPGGPTLAFPIRNWTDADVWDYTEKSGVPIHLDRYEKDSAGTWSEREDRSKNPDWFPACSRCIDRHETEYVFCPKIQGVLNNVGSTLPESVMPTYYGEK